jgi:hypothetical protein
MNEEALQYGYNLFKNDGYNGTLEEYKALISSNKEALDYSYTLFKNDGYKDSVDDFESLLGLKKKEDTASASLDGSLESLQINDDQLYAANKAALSAIGVPSAFGGFLSNALTRGISRGAATDETLKVMYGGKDVTDEDLEKFIKVNQAADAMGQSDAMIEFNKGYEEDIKEGSSEVWAFMNNLAKNPSVASEVMITSLAQMASGALSSKEGFGVVAAGAGTGAGIGFGLGMLGGPLAPATSTIGAVTGSIKGAMSAAGGLTETTSSFVEFLKEELKDKPFTQESIRELLADEEAKQRIINRSLARGATISAIDFLAAGASGVAAKSIKTVGTTGKIARGAATTSIEATGGAGGEIGGRLAAGQELDTREILFEAVGEVPGAAVSGPLGLMSAPKYKVNNGALSKNDFLKIVNTATDEEILSMDIAIDNDEAMADIYNAKVNRAKTKKNIDPTITEQEDIDAVVDREIEIKELKKKDSYSAKNRVKELEAEIKQIQEKYKVAPQEEVVATAEPVVTQPTPQKVADVINRPVTLTELGGSPLENPIEGEIYVEGQQVVLEDADGNITEIGNVDEISDSSLEEIGIKIAEPNVKTLSDGNLQVGEDILVPDKKGIKKNKRGEISRVVLRNEDGSITRTLRGVDAEEAAYQILLKEATSPEQAESINQLLEQDDEFRKATGITQVATDQNIEQVAAGNRLLNEPLQDATEISNRFTERKGLDTGTAEVPTTLDTEKSTRIAKVFDKLKPNPKDPKVKKAYKALATEVLEQYQALLDAGYVIEIDNNDPYKNSADMIADLRDNKRVRILSTEAGFGSDQITDQQREDNPMLADSGLKDPNGNTLLVNDVFRGVHDFFGHAKMGNSFGAKGEEIAWRVHSKMFSPEARRAMTTETRGQNSWVNFSGVNDAAFAKRDQARALREEAQNEKDINKKRSLLEQAEKLVDQAYAEMRFAEQKIGLLPDEFVFEEDAVDSNIEAEVDKLSEILNVPDLSNQIGNSIKALSKIATGVKFVVYETEEQYIKATGDNSSGSYDPNAKVISINASKANPTTVAHETFHAILTNLVKTDAEAKALTERMMKAVSRNAPIELKIYIEEFAADYENNIQSEEKLAELVGVLASEYTTLPTNTQNIIKRWLDKIAKLIGIKPFTDAEVIDVLNTISKKISTGEEIAFEDIDVLGDPNTIGEKMSKRFQSNFTDKVSGLTFTYDVNTEKFNKLEEDGFITRDRSLYDFVEYFMLLHQPDAAFSGIIMKNGEILVEGKGGVFYPIKFHEDGYFWASTARGAEKMANDLNKVYEENNGKILMALTSAPYNKLLSSTTMSNAVLDFFVSKAVDRRFKITKKNVMDAVASAARKTIIVKNKKKGLGLTIDKSKGLDSMLSEIKQKLSADNSTFADRKTFVDTLISEMSDIINSNEVSAKQFGEVFSKGIQNKYFKGVTKTGKLKVSTANMTQAISEMLTEPMLKEGIERKTGGQVYAILEINGPVEAVDSDKHESYPKAIRSVEGQKTVVHILKDRQNWNKNFEDFQTGDLVSKDREKKVFPSSIGISVKGLKLKSRRQVDSVVSIVRRAKDNGISDSAILKYLKDNNLDVDKGFEILDRINQEERRARQKAEGLFDPQRKIVSKFLDSVYKTLMSGRGYRPISMQLLSEYKDGNIEAEIQIARRNVKKIENAIKGEKNPKAVIDSIDKFMRGDKDHNVPASMIGIVSEMRTHLDNLSRKLADSGIVSDTKFDDLPKSERKSLIKKYGGDEQLARQNYRSSKQNILENLGSYLNRSYEVFDNKNYANKVTNQVKQAAKNKLRQMYRKYAEIESLETGVPVEVILSRKVDSIIDGILNQDEGNEFVMKSKVGSKNLTPLEQRKDIPAEIRALMGEYGDPAMNYVRSIQKVAAIIANQNFQNELRKAGEGVYLFTEPTGIYNVKIAGETSESMDILAGMYTTKDIADAMSKGGVINLDFGKFQPIYDFYLKSVGSVKYTKTILSLGTHAKNVIGNIPFMLMTGNFNFSAFNQAIQAIRAEYSANGKPELLAKMDEYTRLGIINQSTTLNEIKDLLSSGKTFEDVMIDRTSDSNYSRVKRAGKGFFRAAEKAYQVEDDFFKIAAYESEKAKYAKAIFKKSVNELTESELKETSERSATVVKNVLPNYGRVGGYVKLLKAAPFAGTFISFISESVRTSYNTLDLTFKEIADPKTRTIGVQRLAGIMSLAAVKAGIIAMWGLSADEEDEDELNNARMFLPFYDENSTIAPTEIKDGQLKYRSISASDPHGYMTKVFNAYINSKNYNEGLSNSLKEAYQPWINPDMTFSVLSELISNRDKNGNAIFKEGDTTEEIALKITQRLWKIAEPGTITSAIKIAKSENPGNEAIGQFTGFKEHTVDVVESIGYKSSDLQRRANESSSDYSRAKKMYDRGEITIQELSKQYEISNSKKKAVYQEAIDLYNGAIYLGANPAEVQQKMIDWGIPTYVLIGVLSGEIPDMRP